MDLCRKIMQSAEHLCAKIGEQDEAFQERRLQTIVDTSALIAYLRKEPPGEMVFTLLEEESVIVPAVCIFELLAGVRLEKHIQQRQELLDLTEIADMDRKISEYAAELFTELRSKGITIDNEDLIVAATSIILDMPLLTSNNKHFKHIRDLKMVSWQGSNQ